MEKKSSDQRTFKVHSFEIRERKRTLVGQSAVIRIYNMIHLLTNRNRKILNVANSGAQRAFQPIVLSAPRIPCSSFLLLITLPEESLICGSCLNDAQIKVIRCNVSLNTRHHNHPVLWNYCTITPYQGWPACALPERAGVVLVRICPVRGRSRSHSTPGTQDSCRGARTHCWPHSCHCSLDRKRATLLLLTNHSDTEMHCLTSVCLPMMPLESLI